MFLCREKGINLQKTEEISLEICYNLNKTGNDQRRRMQWMNAVLRAKLWCWRAAEQGQLSGGCVARADGAGLAPADHYRHQRWQPERCHVRAGPVRDGPRYVAGHPQQGCDGAAGGGCRPFGPAPVPAQRGESRRHGCDPAGRDRGAGSGRGCPARGSHPLRPCHCGAAGLKSPGS